MTAGTQELGARTAPVPTLTRFRRPASRFAWFVAGRSARTAALWAAVTVLYHDLSVIGFFSLGSTAAARNPVLTGFQANSGLKALVGDTTAITSLNGYLDWRIVGVVALITGPWAVLTSTRWLRGEEVAGRWEYVVAGPTSAAAATARTLAGLGAGVATIWLITSVGALAIDARGDVHYSPSSALLLGVTLTSTPAMFLAVGALASQLMSSRSRAGALAGSVLGVAFVLRALGDIAPSTRGLVDVTPLGWVEQIHPLDHAQPLWLLPILVFTGLCSGLAVALAARRDLGASIIAARDTAPAHTRLLGRPVLIALRTGRGSIFGWCTAVFVASVMYGSFASTAQSAVDSSRNLDRLTSSIIGATRGRANAQIFAGVVFLLIMALLMAYAVSAGGNIRETEAEGYLDNLLVRPVRRVPWLVGRLSISTGVIIIAGLLSATGFWLGAVTQHADLTAGELYGAGLNACAPALLTFGIVIAVFGWLPRGTTGAGWTLLAWAFLVQMVGTAMHLDHWVLDTSVLHHVSLSPATPPDWRVNAVYVLLGAGAATAGVWRFQHRDLQSA